MAFINLVEVKSWNENSCARFAMSYGSKHQFPSCQIDEFSPGSEYLYCVLKNEEASIYFSFLKNTKNALIQGRVNSQTQTSCKRQKIVLSYSFIYHSQSVEFIHEVDLMQKFKFYAKYEDYHSVVKQLMILTFVLHRSATNCQVFCNLVSNSHLKSLQLCMNLKSGKIWLRWYLLGHPVFDSFFRLLFVTFLWIDHSSIEISFVCKN